MRRQLQSSDVSSEASGVRDESESEEVTEASSDEGDEEGEEEEEDHDANGDSSRTHPSDLPDDPAEIEAVAREQWIERGFNPADFAVEKMYEIWAEEEAEGLGVARAGNLRRKLDLIEMDDELRWVDFQRLRKSATGYLREVKGFVRQKAEETKEMLTPSFIEKRRRLLAYRERVQKCLESEKQLRLEKIERKRSERRRRAIQKKQDMEHERKLEKREALLRMSQKSSQIIVSASSATVLPDHSVEASSILNLDMTSPDDVESPLRHKKNSTATFWKQIAAETRVEAEAALSTGLALEIKRQTNVEQMLLSEEEERERNLDESLNFAMGESSQDISDQCALHETEAAEAFSRLKRIEKEISEAEKEVNEIQVLLQRLNEQAKASRSNSRQLAENLSAKRKKVEMRTTKWPTDAEMQDHDETAREMLRESDFLQSRMNEISRLNLELSVRLLPALDKLRVARDKAEQHHKEARDALEEYLKDTPTLPLIVGKSLRMPSPKSYKVLQASKAILLEDAAISLGNLKRDIGTAAHQEWRAQRRRNSIVEELEASQEQLKRTQNRIDNLMRSRRRMEICNSLDQFFATGGISKLKRVSDPFVASFDWLDFASDAKNVVKVGEMLSPSDERGNCEGIVQLPKGSALYSVQFQVSLLDVESHTKSDHETAGLTFRVGTSFGTLRLVGKFTGLNNLSRPANVQFCGQNLCFRLQFRMQKNGPRLGVGKAQVKELPSDFIARERMKQIQGEDRAFLLLREYMNIKFSQAKTWDTDLIQHTAQRFPRVTILKIIEDEIAKERGSLELMNRDKLGIPRIDETLAHRKHLRSSLQRMTERKQKGVDMEFSRSLIGMNLEVFFQDEGRWCVTKVQDLKQHVRPEDDTREILHLVSVEGRESWINLLDKKFEELKVDVRESKQARQKINRFLLKEEQEKQDLEEATRKRDQQERERVVTRQRREKKEFESLRNSFIAKTMKEAENSAADLLRESSTMKELLGSEHHEQFVHDGQEIARMEADDRWVHGLEKLVRRHEDELLEVDERISRRKASEKKILALKEKFESEKWRERIKERGKELKIINFNRCIIQSGTCDHEKVRFWGSRYKKGIRCLKCDEELSRSHENQNQASERDPEFGAAVFEHRRHEASESRLSPRMAAEVHQRRLEVEKEEREIEIGSEYVEEDLGFVAVAFPLRERLSKRAEANLAYMERFQRLRNFKRRIESLEAKLGKSKQSSMALQASLENVHINRVRLSKRLLEVEAEYFRALDLLKERQDSIKNCNAVEAQLQDALQQRIRFEIRLEENRKLVNNAQKMKNIQKEFLESVVEERAAIQKKFGLTQQQVDAAQKEARKLHLELDESRLSLRLAKWRKCRKSPIFLPPFAMRLGVAKLCKVRGPDDMALIILNASGQSIKIFVPLEKIVSNEMHREQCECLLMQQEEEDIRERVAIMGLVAMENLLKMRQEESLQRQYEEIQLRASKIATQIQLARTQAMLDSARMLRGKCKQEELRQLALERVAREHNELVSNLYDFQRYKNSGFATTPRPFSRNERFSRQKRYFKELCIDFQVNHANAAEKRVKEAIKNADESRMETAAIDIILQEMLHKETREVAEQMHKSNIDTSLRLMLSSNNYFQGIPLSSTGVIKGLITLRIDQIEELEESLHQLKPVMNRHLGQMEEDKKVLKRLGLAANQAAELSEMRKEEASMRKWLRIDLRLSLEERRMMADAEAEMRHFIAMEAFNEDVLSTESVDSVTQHNCRRHEIKMVIVERRKAKRERLEMVKEDELSCQVRFEHSVLLREKERQALKDKESFDDNDDTGHDLTLTEKIRLEMEGQELQAEMERRWRSVELMIAVTKFAEVELELVHAEGLLERKRLLLRQLTNKFVKSSQLLKEGREKAASAERELTQFTKLKDESEAQAENFREIVDKLRPKALSARRHRFNTLKETEYMWTSVNHASEQRFRTEVIKDELHRDYFYLMASEIANDTEILCLERRLQERLDQFRAIEVELQRKRLQVVKIKRTWRLEGYLKLSRSELGKIIFQEARAKTLRQALLAWKSGANFVARTRIAFETKMSIARHQKEVEMLKNNNEKASPSRKAKRLMEIHNNRFVKCTNCKAEFMESTNHAKACQYHPGEFKIGCPSTCPHSSKTGGVKLACAVHYRKHWTCCDKIEAKPFGNAGCSLRWHVAESPDPTYAFQVEVASDESRTQSEMHAKKAELAAKWRNLAKREKFEDLEEMRVELERQRDLVSQHDNEKF